MEQTLWFLLLTYNSLIQEKIDKMRKKSLSEKKPTLEELENSLLSQAAAKNEKKKDVLERTLKLWLDNHDLRLLKRLDM